jgi:tetratricopeptide (TPR) repeat protein
MNSFRSALIALFLFPSVFMAQKKADSLTAILATAKEDTSKVSTLCLLAYELKSSDPKKAIEVCGQAIALGKKIGDEKGVGVAYTNLALAQIRTGEFDQAIQNGTIALGITHRYNDKANESKAYNTIGEAYRLQDNFLEALKYYEPAIKLREEIGDTKGIANVINNIALVQYSLGNYPESIKRHLQALKIREAVNDKEGVAASYSNMAMVYVKQLNNKEAISCNEKALAIRTEMNDKRGMATSYNNIGNIYRLAYETEKAKANYEKALTLFTTLDDKKNIALCYNNLGCNCQSEADMMVKNGRQQDVPEKIKEALAYFERANRGYEETKSISGLLLIQQNIGHANKTIHNYSVARSHYMKSLELANQIGSKEDSKDLYGYLASIDSLTGDYKSAFRNYVMHIQLKENLLNEENTKKTVRQEMQYSFDKKEIEAKAEQEKKDALVVSEKKRQNMFLLLISIVLLFAIIFSVYVQRSLSITRKQKHIIEDQKTLVETKQQEILDSLHYAKRIQRALLPTEPYIHRALKQLNISR